MSKDIFVPLMQRWGHDWGPELFRDFLKSLPDIPAKQMDASEPEPQPEPETTPSYRYVSDRTPSEPSPTGVLNSTYRIVARKQSAGRDKSEEELVAEQWEEDMFERDMLLSLVRSTAKRAEKWVNKKPEKRKPVANYFDVRSRKLVERMYGERGEEMLEAMDTLPEDVLPLILKRLRDKEDEIKQCILSRSRMGLDGPYFL